MPVPQDAVARKLNRAFSSAGAQGAKCEAQRESFVVT
jgi:hypothetical protein